MLEGGERPRDSDVLLRKHPLYIISPVSSTLLPTPWLWRPPEEAPSVYHLPCVQHTVNYTPFQVHRLKSSLNITTMFPTNKGDRRQKMYLVKQQKISNLLSSRRYKSMLRIAGKISRTIAKLNTTTTAAWEKKKKMWRSLTHLLPVRGLLWKNKDALNNILLLLCYWGI